MTAHVLNEIQLSVLKWVADGCPAGVMDGYDHRISAAALRTRGLLQVTGRGPTWHAELTERGRSYLQEPDPGPQGAQRSTRSSPTPPRPVRKRSLSPTEQLIADLIAAGGVLRVPAWPRPGERNHEALVRSAQHFNKIPVGKRLTTDRDRDVLEIRLVDAIEGTVLETKPVTVPTRVSKLHAVARRFRDQTSHHEIAKASITRCTRIIHAIAIEAERRGMKIGNVSAAKESNSYERWSGGNDGHIAITVREHQYKLRIFEEKVPARGRFERENTYTEWIGHHAYTRRRPGRYDANATGRLTITILGHSGGGRPSSYGDRRSWTLEDKLPELLRELEVRAAEDDHRHAEARRAAQERQRIWEEELERAKARFAEAHRAAVLRNQIVAWNEANAARVYLAQLELDHGGHPDAAEWMAWIKRYIEHLDPLFTPPAMPPLPEPSAEELKPFMAPGISPYGPRGW